MSANAERATFRAVVIRYRLIDIANEIMGVKIILRVYRGRTLEWSDSNVPEIVMIMKNITYYFYSYVFICQVNSGLVTYMRFPHTKTSFLVIAIVFSS